ncbi:RNA-directed DNA polymerase from mobile element jockey [Anthophora retusa]
MTWNACSLFHKFTELELILNLNNVAAAMIQETWLTGDRTVYLQNYNIIRRDRPNGVAHGGVAILVHKNLNFIPYPLPDTGEVEAIAVKIIPSNLIILSVYWPPSVRITDDVLNKLFCRRQPFLAGLDINAKHRSWNNHSYNRNGMTLRRHADQAVYDLIYLPTFTHFQPNSLPSTLDLFITNWAAKLQPEVVNDLQSDHRPVLLITPPSSSRSTNFTSSVLATDWDNYRANTSKIPLRTNLSSQTDIDHAILDLNSSLKICFRKSCQLVPSIRS